MNPYFEAIKKSNAINDQGAKFLFFDTTIVYDSGNMDIVTTIMPDPDDPNKNYQIIERINHPFEKNIGEIIGKQHDIIIKHFNAGGLAHPQGGCLNRLD